MRRYAQVRRCRDTFINASGQVELGAVARAEKPAAPAFARPNLEILERCTTEMGAGAFHDQVFGPDRARFVRRIVGLLLGDQRVRVAKLAVVRKSGQHAFVAPQHEYQAAAPQHADHLARLHRRQRHFDRRAERLGPGAGLQRREKGNRSGTDTDGAGDSGCYG